MKLFFQGNVSERKLAAVLKGRRADVTCGSTIPRNPLQIISKYLCQILFSEGFILTFFCHILSHFAFYSYLWSILYNKNQRR